MTDAEIEALCIEAGLMTRYERGGTVLVFAEDLSRPEMVEGVRKVLELAAQQQAEPPVMSGAVRALAKQVIAEQEAAQDEDVKAWARGVTDSIYGEQQAEPGADERAGVAEPEGWREFITEVAQQRPEKPDHWSPCGQCQHNAERAQDLIEAAPAQQQKDD